MERRGRGVADECRRTTQARLHRIDPREERREFRVLLHALVVDRRLLIALRFDARGPLCSERANGVRLAVRLALERLRLRRGFRTLKARERVLHFRHTREHAHSRLLRQNNLRKSDRNWLDTSLRRRGNASENRLLCVCEACVWSNEFVEAETCNGLHRPRERLLEVLRGFVDRGVTLDERLRVGVGVLHLPEEIRLHHDLQAVGGCGLHERTFRELLAAIDLRDVVDEERPLEVQTRVAFDARGLTETRANRDLVEVDRVRRAVEDKHGHDGKSECDG